MLDTADPASVHPLVHRVPLRRPLRWLALGWRDFRRTWVTSVIHGALVGIGAWVILAITLEYWYLLPGAFSGFLLVGPILATGLYEVSRRLELGERPGMAEAISAWRRGTRPLVWLGLILVLAGTAWVLVSAVLFALFVHEPLNGVRDVVRYIVLSEGSNLFAVWIMLGGVGAALVFAATVVSAPMLLDRDTDMPTAIATSVNAVSENPHAMALWAAIIMLASVLALLTLAIGFVLIIPVIGNATWHAYRDLVDASMLPARH